MKTLARRAAGLSLLYGWASVCTCNALVLAQSDLLFDTLEITPDSSSSALVVFTVPWTALAFAEANGVGTFDPTTDGLTPAFTSSTDLLASGSATATPDSLPLLLSELASSSVNISDSVEASSFSAGRGTLLSSFKLTGGAGDVDVTFSVHVSGNLMALTSYTGASATTETMFTGELDGSPLLFRRDTLSIGPGDFKTSSFSSTLTATRTLAYDTEYFLLLESDSESRGRSDFSTVPESTHYGIGAAGLILLKILARRRKSAPAPSLANL